MSNDPTPSEIAAACVAGWEGWQAKGWKRTSGQHVPEVQRARDLAGKRVGVSGMVIDKLAAKERQHAGVNQHTKSLEETFPQGSRQPQSRDLNHEREERDCGSNN